MVFSTGSSLQSVFPEYLHTTLVLCGLTPIEAYRATMTQAVSAPAPLSEAGNGYGNPCAAAKFSTFFKKPIDN